MKFSIKLLVAIWLVLFGTVASYAQALSPGADNRAETAVYVAETGDDLYGDGSFARPYQTVAGAAQQAPPQATIYVRGGAYDGGSMLFSVYGAGSQLVPVRAYPGEAVLFSR